MIVERTVLFADLRGSTGLYESLGNTEASQLVTQSVTLVARIVQLSQGYVVKTLGDGLMATFLDPLAAVQAAREMHEALDRIGSVGDNSISLKLQVGLARGEVVEISGDYFGDAVNVAARLLDHAGDNETLVTGPVFEAIPEEMQGRFRSLEKMQLRGRIEPVHVYLQDNNSGLDSHTTAYVEMDHPAQDPEGIRLVWGPISRVFSAASLPIIIGRSPQATYCVDDVRVSRNHARIEWHSGGFQLTDLSYNGTFIRFVNDKEMLTLRRGSCTLHGSGTIYLGLSSEERHPPSIYFEVMRFTDTQPQMPPDLQATSP